MGLSESEVKRRTLTPLRICGFGCKSYIDSHHPTLLNNFQRKHSSTNQNYLSSIIPGSFNILTAEMVNGTNDAHSTIITVHSSDEISNNSDDPSENR